MKKRRPTAFDREMSDVLTGLKSGDYTLSVVSRDGLYGFGPVRLKAEGAVDIDLDDKIIFIAPVAKRNVA